MTCPNSFGLSNKSNHFIEIQKDEDNYIWAMIHSGSRNLGKKVADHYNNIAKELNHKWYSSVPKKYDLAFLPLDSQEGQDYLNEMQYCADFAFANRSVMMRRVLRTFQSVLDVKLLCFNSDELEKPGPDYIDTAEPINIAHNYASLENHYGKNVVVHRKGATLAREGTIGIIPGSQGTASYIVRGLGNPESFNSCSHGAGRKMGRKQAQRSLNLEAEQKRLDDKGIIHSIRNVKDLDEASGAYKDIDVVMEEQKDLVEIVTKLEPIAVIKG